MEKSRAICDPDIKHCGSCPGCILNAAKYNGGYADLNQDLTELVGCEFHRIDELNKGKLETEYDVTKWIGKYRGTQNLPPYTVELNNFRLEVDQFVTLIMSVINRHAWQRNRP